jgi:hypothetical protein
MRNDHDEPIQASSDLRKQSEFTRNGQGPADGPALPGQVPDICEGVIMLDRIEHFFTCKVDGDFIVMNLLPGDKAEEILNKGDLSTIEPWSPWPGSEHKH